MLWRVEGWNMICQSGKRTNIRKYFLKVVPEKGLQRWHFDRWGFLEKEVFQAEDNMSKRWTGYSTEFFFRDHPVWNV